MPDKKVKPEFYTALLNRKRPIIKRPVNMNMLQQQKKVVLEKVTNLLSYQDYLADARKWKATTKKLSPAFESEVLTNSRLAYNDANSLISETLNMTKHLKHAGVFDDTLDTMVSAVKTVQEISIKDIITDFDNNNDAKRILREEGIPAKITDELRSFLKEAEGKFFVQNGKLAGEMKLSGESEIRRGVFTNSPGRKPRTLSDLLKRGKFEDYVSRFSDNTDIEFHLIETNSKDIDISESIAANAVQTRELFSFHKRKLEDTGLPTLVGNSALIIVGIILLVALIASLILTYTYCDSRELSDPLNSDSAGCVIGGILFYLVLIVLLLGVSKEITTSCPGYPKDCGALNDHVN